MLNTGILNPQILSLLARVRHTNALIISDRGFPFWPMIEIVDISLVDNVPTVLQVLASIRKNFNATEAFMAREFEKNNSTATSSNPTLMPERRGMPSVANGLPFSAEKAVRELETVLMRMPNHATP